MGKNVQYCKKAFKYSSAATYYTGPQKKKISAHFVMSKKVMALLMWKKLMAFI